MTKSEELFAKHWTEATNKPCDSQTMHHMRYAINAIDEALNIGDVEKITTKLSYVFTNKSKNHIGKNINEVPELIEIINAIEVINKYCS